MKYKKVSYEMAKVYKITSPQTNKIYIGGTCLPLNQRLERHKTMYKRHTNGKSKAHTYANDILQHDDCTIELIETFPCTNRKELSVRERYYIEQNKENCINKVIPSRKQSEWKETNKDKIKEYYKNSREKLLKYRKEYYQKNKNKISQISAQHYQDYLEKHREYAREYYQKNKERHKLVTKQYYIDHIEKCKEQNRIYAKKYYVENKDKCNEYSKNYYHQKKGIANDTTLVIN
jgi:hypothetical protein